jgi:hypothetical protein
MGLPTLHHALKLGYSSRYGDRKGMGRFGVGAKLAGISQAQRIDIYSRQSVSADWLHTHIDLEDVRELRMKCIPAPEAASLPKDCEDLVGDKGTLVIWSKTDRLEETESGGGRRADTVKTDLVNYIARTFRKFLDNKISIMVDDQDVCPHDPLYLMTSTRWHQDGSPDPVAEIKVNETFEFSIPSDSSKKSKVHVTLTLLPKEFRLKRGEGGNDFAKSRRIDENEGISILRADREIFHGYLRDVQPSQDQKPIDRFIGKEIRFEPDLDECFQVRNVKKGAEPIDSLRDKLRELIFKTIITLRREIQLHYHNVAKQALQEQGLHAEAEKIAAETCRTARKPRAGKDMPAEERDKKIDAAVESLTKEVPSEQKEQKKEKVKAQITQQPITIVPEAWPGQEFIAIEHLGSNAIVRINMQHPFYAEVYAKLVAAEKQEEDAKVKEMANIIRNGIDLLIIGYAKAEGQFDDTTIFDGLRTNWGLELQNLIQHWSRKR